MAADGYPGNYQKGQPIHGADQLETADGTLVFHAGTASADDGQLISAGGRVLAVTALGNDRQLARNKAYAAVKTIFWPDPFKIFLKRKRKPKIANETNVWGVIPYKGLIYFADHYNGLWAVKLVDNEPMGTN